jgi:hypothetical protein
MLTEMSELDKSKMDPKVKMLEALEKKKRGNSANRPGGPAGNSKIGSEAGANAPKMFRRKSGSA